MQNTLLRLPEVLKKTGLSRSSLYLAINNGTFPKGIKISERGVAFIESEVDEWVQNRIADSRAEGVA